VYGKPIGYWTGAAGRHRADFHLPELYICIVESTEAWGHSGPADSREGGTVTELAGRLGDDDYARLDRQLEDVDSQLAARYPGSAGARQPVHTVYVPADRCHPGLPGEWGAQALAVLAEHGPSAARSRRRARPAGRT
jgi:hypothetical protein